MARHTQLNSAAHGALRVRRDFAPALGDEVMWAPAFPYEFRQLQPHYPIVFRTDAASRSYRPIALFGFESDQNLFLSDQGWDAAYVPLAIRMRPFLIGRAADGAGSAPTLEVHIDLDHPRVSDTQGEALFLEDGGLAPALQEAQDILVKVHQGEQTVAPVCALLDELGLLEPFTLDVTLKDGTSGRLAGFHTISEERLYSLNGEALGRLQAAGALQPVFMAVASLSQLSALVERRNARVAPLF